ncbi:MAG: thioredoxin family protein [Planctomycetota bacterium]
MVKTASTMLPLGTKAPDFSLVNVDGRTVSLADFEGSPALLVIFMCNHCPFVKHVAPELARLGHEYQSRGVAVVGISSNDVSVFPADSPEQMIHEAELQGYSFAYLYDETQEVAQAYKAACTPDFFLFDGEQKLVYRGQLDASRPGNGIPVTGDDLRRAIDAVLAGQAGPTDQTPSIGCNIKWKEGCEPDYFNPAGTG